MSVGDDEMDLARSDRAHGTSSVIVGVLLLLTAGWAWQTRWLPLRWPIVLGLLAMAAYEIPYGIDYWRKAGREDERANRIEEAEQVVLGQQVLAGDEAAEPYRVPRVDARDEQLGPR